MCAAFAKCLHGSLCRQNVKHLRLLRRRSIQSLGPWLLPSLLRDTLGMILELNQAKYKTPKKAIFVFFFHKWFPCFQEHVLLIPAENESIVAKRSEAHRDPEISFARNIGTPQMRILWRTLLHTSAAFALPTPWFWEGWSFFSIWRKKNNFPSGSNHELWQVSFPEAWYLLSSSKKWSQNNFHS